MSVKLRSKLGVWAILKKVFVVILILVLLILLVSYLYESYFLNKTTKTLKPAGLLVKVNSHDMHVYAKGQGNETVVFAAGNGTPSPYADFYNLHNEIAKHSRVVVYERPGYGFSETANDSRDIDTIVWEIRECLSKTNQEAPYIFVAHSLSSLEVFRYAQLYPNEVKAILLLDGGSPNYYLNNQDAKKFEKQVSVMRILKKFGLFRLQANLQKDKFFANINSNKNNLELLPTQYKDLNNTMFLKHLISKDALNEIKSLKSNAQKVVDGGYLGDIPLRILTAEVSAQRLEEGLLKWKTSQEQLTRWSTNSSQVVIKDTNHFIHQYKPQLINKEILDLVNSVK
ncbi:alpha/beta hydrolase [Clostridium sp. 'deep sea']|uniref:alpha/beta hydrolase n=1 Tax=Clostridium sp. 'deep sea' TaxID=2779445 RepID=UPI00189668E2|nr:alpha/beta hydrolase [Clostridium sp. 'deep sea']QOR36806.1 alpha/beta hydrolase [Clostridium sp. 'deep sea']